MELSPPAVRVLGSLIEKALATPQSYPLSLNALGSATNQSTNRDPVVDYDEAGLRAALQELSNLDLVSAVYANRSHTPKYAQALDAYLEIGDPEIAVLGVLMLRGPQTLGELRQRTERLSPFAELRHVQSVLESLRDHRYGALAAEVPRQPGQKEGRWCHLLGATGTAIAAAGDSADGHTIPVGAAGRSAVTGESADARITELAAEVEALRDDVETLQHELDRLRRFVGA